MIAFSILMMVPAFLLALLRPVIVMVNIVVIVIGVIIVLIIVTANTLRIGAPSYQRLYLF